MTLNNLNVFFHVYGNSRYTFISHFKPVMYKDFEKKKNYDQNIFKYNV